MANSLTKNFPLKRYFAFQIISKNRPALDDLLKLPSIFFISTGRCGTTLISKILENSEELTVVHNPLISLEYSSSRSLSVPLSIDQKKEVIYAARVENYFVEAYQKQRIYVETNNRITTFCDVLYNLMPNSLFVHIIRDPKDFCANGINRQYYATDRFDQYQRLFDHKEIRSSKSQLEKIVKEWNIINDFIENFKSRDSAKRIYTIKFEDMISSSNVLNNLWNELGIFSEILSLKTQDLLTNKHNQSSESIVRFDQWNDTDKDIFLKSIDQNLISKYGYID